MENVSANRDEAVRIKIQTLQSLALVEKERDGLSQELKLASEHI